MNVNREEALRAKDRAEEMIKQSHFFTARRLAIKADKMDSSLNLSKLIQICEVHCAATTKFGKDLDWYGILQVEPEADGEKVKKQYKKLALILHPDKNKFAGAEDAFKLVGQAYEVLADKAQKAQHDKARWFHQTFHPGSTSHQNHPPSTASHQNHPPSTASHQEHASHEEHTRKRTRFVFESSSSSDSDSTFDEEKVPEFVHLSDDDVHEEKKTQEEDVPDVEEEKKTQEEDVPDVQQEEKEEKQEGGRIFYDAPEFSDFDKLREESCFEANQIWALYDDGDGMPRVYALIKEVSREDFVLHCAWLELAEDEENEDRRPDLPVSVGDFEVESEVQTNSISMFSHLVYIVTGRNTRGKKKFTVFPKKGETWALFKNWDSVSPLKYEYDFVEILSARAQKKKVSVGLLSKVEGYVCVFRPMGKQISWDILPHEYFRFSHCVPSFRLTGAEGRGITEGWYELDPAAIP